jgi:hypothetical protein
MMEKNINVTLKKFESLTLILRIATKTNVSLNSNDVKLNQPLSGSNQLKQQRDKYNCLSSFGWNLMARLSHPSAELHL